MKLTKKLCEIDDFCKLFMPEWDKYFISLGYRQRCRESRMMSRHLYNWLSERSLELITNVRKNMKHTFKIVYDKFLLGKRRIIESVFEQLKSHAQVEHTKYRIVSNFLVNVMWMCCLYISRSKAIP